MNFRIVENYEPDINYEEFKKDFLNVNTRSKDVRKKYGLSKKYWDMYRRRVCEEEGILKKPYNREQVFEHYSRSHPIKTGHEFIRDVGNGFAIVKTINHHTTNYGRYPNLECAMKVRDKLVESNWDKDTARRLKSKYALDRLKPAKVKALKLYNRFEWLYIYSDKLVKDILKELGFTCKMHGYVLEELHRIHGNYSRNELKKMYGVPIVPKRRSYR